MADDRYLWDRSGDPDPEIRRLEELLGPLRSARPAPDFDVVVREAAPRQAHPAAAPAPILPRAPLLAAAAALGLALVAVWWMLGSAIAPTTMVVTRLAGSPRIGASEFGDAGSLAVGQTLETDAASRARVAVGRIGQVDVGPGTVLRLIEHRAAEHRLALDRGNIHARIWAPPRQFFVETPSAVAVDLGCEYTLHVDDDGVGRLRVRHGWVGFEVDGRESFIPAGAMCFTRPASGPGTPYYEDAPAALRSAVDRLDTGDVEPEGRGVLLAELLGAARRRDAFTLWHLLPRVDASERERVYEVLAALVPPPRGVTREGVLGGEAAMLEAWWDRLGLESTDWWRMWKLPEAPG